MTRSARRAYGLARVSVLKAGLRRPAHVGGQVVAPAPESLPDPPSLFDELLAVYRTVLRGYPELAAVLDALLARHELANVLLAVNVLLTGRPASLRSTLWRPLAELSTFAAENAAACATVAELAAALRGTRLAGIEALIRSATAESMGAATLAAERQVWRQIGTAFEMLPRGEIAARRLGELLLLEHDFDWVHRAPAVASIERLAAARATLVLERALPGDALTALAAWTPTQGALGQLLPLRWSWRRDAGDWESLALSIRRARRRQCERAFAGPPFSLALPLSVVLLKEEEARAVAAFIESGGRRSPATERAQAASLLGT